MARDPESVGASPVVGETILGTAAPLLRMVDVDVASLLDRKDPIPTRNDPGVAPDGLDELPLFTDRDIPFEDALTLERVLEDANTHPGVAEMVDVFHLRKTDEERFEAFFEAGAAQALVELCRRYGIGTSSPVCDLGCGAGWLAHALTRLGFGDVTAMDTSPEATAYLRSIAGDRIDVIFDLDVWRGIRSRFDALLSFATVHHWEHIPWIALEARRTMKPGAFWFAVMEWFADTPAEFLEAMSTHPARTRYRYYEWAYPVAAYVDLIQSVGFTLVSVVPLWYRKNVFMTVRPPVPTDIDEELLEALVDERLTGPNGTVELFWAEVDARRRKPVGGRLFTRPQVLVFQRTAP
jgi:SAM-dependent methyltransferase